MSDGEPTDFGPCCICEIADVALVRNLVMLDQRAPVADTGWGCVQCGIGCDGALAVLCEDCLAQWQKGEATILFVCRGLPTARGRAPAAELAPEWFGHDVSKHPELKLH